MKIALIGDVHANLPALEAVLAHAREQQVEAIWNAGDWLGYGAFPNEVVERLRQEKALSIIGNYDLKALETGQEPERKVKKSDKKRAFRWAYEQLSKQNRKYLRSLSREMRMQVQGRRVLLTHGSPDSNDEHLGPDTPEERLRQLAKKAKADVVVCGHSHQPFARQVDGVWFINTGSVGRPDDGDPRAAYAVLEVTAGQLQVTHHRVDYDVERAAAAIRAHKLPEDFAQMILQGRSLEAILGRGSKERPAPPAEAPGAAPAGETAAAPLEEGGDGSAAAVPAGRPAPEEHLPEVLELAQRHSGGDDHFQQVTRLALQLYDELGTLHGLGPQERLWLQCAGLLHDIGWAEGWKSHHKSSLRMILEAPTLPFGRRERLLIGSIARYHRRALPKDTHEHYAALKPQDQRVVSILAALLRVADGLDCTHESVITDLHVEVTPEEIAIHCTARGETEDEFQDAMGKADLLEEVFGRRLTIA